LRPLLRGLVNVLAVLAIAALLLAGGMFLLRNRDNVEPSEEEWHVLVRGEVTSGGRFIIEDMETLGGTEITITLMGTGEDGREHEYRGIPLGSLIEAAAPSTNATKVTVRAVDSYSKTLSLEGTQGAYLVWEKDGKSIPPRSRAGDGPVRLLVSQEMVGTYNAQHCVKWVSEVIVE
jgi:DMSO/TMAO reductase YedYZ molybdopterin-dependent catalytic subunit